MALGLMVYTCGFHGAIRAGVTFGFRLWIAAMNYSSRRRRRSTVGSCNTIRDEK